jgi:hypothetical protein
MTPTPDPKDTNPESTPLRKVASHIWHIVSSAVHFNDGYGGGTTEMYEEAMNNVIEILAQVRAEGFEAGAKEMRKRCVDIIHDKYCDDLCGEICCSLRPLPLRPEETK